MKKWWVITVLIAIILVIIGSIGIYTYYINLTSNKNSVKAKKLADGIKEVIIDENTITTSKVEDKISPNASVIKKTYYELCGHEIREIEDIPNELINKNKEDAQNFFTNWDIIEYSPNKIELYKKENKYCGSHFALKSHNGVIGIFEKDEKGNEVFLEDTQIQTKYLPEIDLINLEKGINVIGEEGIKTALEDFE